MDDEVDAVSLFVSGAYIEALAALEKLAVARGLSGEELYARAASLLYGKQAAGEAVEAFLKAREAGKSGFWIDFHEACARANAGDYAGAMRLFASCASIDPQPAVIRSLRSFETTVAEGTGDTALIALMKVLHLPKSDDRFLESHLYKQDIELLNSKGLFVVGAARSGTTITLEHLNASKDVLLLSEMEFAVLQRYPDYFAGYGGTDPVVNYNAKQASLGQGLDSKGFSIPSAMTDAYRERLFWSKLGDGYKYVGEKMALLQEQKAGRYLMQDTIDWHMNAAPLAHYLLCMRNPGQIARSYVQKWQRGGARLMMYLILVFEGQMRMWRSMPNARIIPHHRWTETGQRALAEWLDIDLAVRSDIDPSPRVHDTVVPESLAVYSEALNAMCDSYDRGMALLSADDSVFPFQFSRAACETILAGLDEARQLLTKATPRFFIETAFEA